MAKAKAAQYYGTGRRKKSIARVYLVPGKGDIKVNKRSIDEYFGLETLKVIVRQPLKATETADKFDVLVNVKGGGYTGQAGAIRHGIARALLQADADFRPVLKKAGYLTRDPRMKERNTVSKPQDAHHNFQRDKDYLRNADMEKEPWQIYLPMALFVYARFHWNSRHDRHGAKRSGGFVLVPQIIHGKRSNDQRLKKKFMEVY